MKPTNPKTPAFLLAIAATVLTVGLVSWDQQQTPGQYSQSLNDTTPKKPARPTDGKSTDRDKKVRDLDDVLEELDHADMKIDFDKIRKEVAEALKNVDVAKIRMEVEKALKEVDMENIKVQVANAMKEVDMAKIQKEVRESLSKVDFDKIKIEIADAMKEVEMDKIQKEVEESLAKVDFDKIKLDMEKFKDIDMKKLEEDMKKLSEEMKELGPKMEKEMLKAKKEIEKAKTTIKEYKVFVDGLEKDGLISKKEGYTLKHKDGKLFINGKIASEQTYNKYRSFLDQHKKFNIEKSDDDFDIDMD